jgi:hypothetical protein
MPPEYYLKYQRKKRLKNKVCAKCGEQAYFKDLLTQEYLCAKDMVEPVKQQILKQKEENTTIKC